LDIIQDIDRNKNYWKAVGLILPFRCFLPFLTEYALTPNYLIIRSKYQVVASIETTGLKERVVLAVNLLEIFQLGFDCIPFTTILEVFQKHDQDDDKIAGHPCE
jgi:hypothetical protein